MKLVKALSVLFLLSLMAAVPLATDPAAWKGLTPDQIARVKKGEIVIMDQNTAGGTGDAARFIQAAMIFNQPVEKAYALFRKTENQPRFLPDLASAKLVSRNDKGDQVDFHVVIAGISVDYRIHHVYDDAKCWMSWGLDPSFDNDIKKSDGYWHLYKLDDTHTLARYGTDVNISSLLPEFIVKRLTRTSLPENLEGVKKYINSGGTYIKPGFKG